LEASWNLAGQQNIGFAAAVSPVLNFLYKGRPDDLASARQRVLQFFNTNPMLSGLVIGVALKLEEEKARGRIEDRQLNLIISSMASTLAGHGDLLFWQTWLPFCCILGFGLTWLSLAFGQVTWIPLIIPVLFCAFTGPVRFGGLFYGYRRGLETHKSINTFHVKQIVKWVQRLTVLLSGLLTTYSLKLIPEVHNPNGSLILSKELFLTAVVVSVLGLVLIQRFCPLVGPKSLYVLTVIGLASVTVFI
jgi:PTS system mannose-specific IID component